eukprot:Transcript_18066.p1 GENE.Transcript_18066~~Transcript_18066.p1  ORF type:complete len:360 (-),score=57.98 Transcript_18066:895-1974(-)
MTTTITGAAGFLGQRMVRLLAARGEKLVLTDVHKLPSLPPSGATVLTGPLAHHLPQAITEETTAVVHLAAVVSAGAEADFDLGYDVNLSLLLQVLERCRVVGTRPKLLFTSSLAVFGAIDVADDASACQPSSSYGTQKALGELLVNDYSRKGFVDGRTLRLPTVSIRPGKPNKAASGFASSILREPLAGQPAVCPVPEEATLWLGSPVSASRAMLHGLDLPAEAFAEAAPGTGGGSVGGLPPPSWRTVNVPGISVSVREMMAALRRARRPRLRTGARGGAAPARAASRAAPSCALETDQAGDALPLSQARAATTASCTSSATRRSRRSWVAGRRGSRRRARWRWALSRPRTWTPPSRAT